MNIFLTYDTVVGMQKTITMTTKGTFTLPAAIRAKLGVNAKGDKLAIEFDESTGRVFISKPADLTMLHSKLAPYTRKVKPLTNPSAFYRKRKPRI